jgi:hypothetical protein
MENAIAVQSNPATKGRQVEISGNATANTTKRPSILKWYRILRVHYHWPLFQAIRYALWLSQ